MKATYLSVNMAEIFQIQRRGWDSLTTQGRHWCGVLPILTDSCTVYAPDPWRDITRWCGDCKEQAPITPTLYHSALIFHYKLQLTDVSCCCFLPTADRWYYKTKLLKVVPHTSKCNHKIPIPLSSVTLSCIFFKLCTFNDRNILWSYTQLRK